MYRHPGRDQSNQARGLRRRSLVKSLCRSRRCNIHTMASLRMVSLRSKLHLEGNPDVRSHRDGAPIF